MTSSLNRETPDAVRLQSPGQAGQAVLAGEHPASCGNRAGGADRRDAGGCHLSVVTPVLAVQRDRLTNAVALPPSHEPEHPMAQNITLSSKALVEAAEREVETLAIEDAIKLHGRDDVVL